MPQRPGLETGVELAGAVDVSTAEDVVASWRKIRSLRRRFHRSSSLASSPNSKLKSLGDLNFFSLRPFSEPSLALSAPPDPESRLLGAWLGGMLLDSSGPFFPRSSPEGDFFLILISLSESVYSNSVPRCKGFNHQSKPCLSQEGTHPAGNFCAPWEMLGLFSRALTRSPFPIPTSLRPPFLSHETLWKFPGSKPALLQTRAQSLRQCGSVCSLPPFCPFSYKQNPAGKL